MAEWMTTTEAAKLLKISRRQVINRIHNGRLRAKRIGRLWFIDSLLLANTEGVEEVAKADVEEVPKGYSKEAFEKLEEMVYYLKEQIEHMDRKIERHQEIMMQLSRDIEESIQILMEGKRGQKLPSWRRRVFGRGGVSAREE